MSARALLWGGGGEEKSAAGAAPLAGTRATWDAQARVYTAAVRVAGAWDSGVPAVIDSGSHYTVLATAECRGCAEGPRYDASLTAAPTGTTMQVHYHSQTSHAREVWDVACVGGLCVRDATLHAQFKAQGAPQGRGLSVLGLGGGGNGSGSRLHEHAASATQVQGASWGNPWLEALRGGGQPAGWALEVPSTPGADGWLRLGSDAAHAAARDMRIPLLPALPDPPSADVAGAGMYVAVGVEEWSAVLHTGALAPLPSPPPAAFIVDTGSTRSALPPSSLPGVLRALYHPAVYGWRVRFSGGAEVVIPMHLQTLRRSNGAHRGSAAAAAAGGDGGAGDGEPSTYAAIGDMPDALQYSVAGSVGVLGVTAMRGARVGCFPGEGVLTWGALA